ncbi:MAG TPA: hypothetical protein VGP72_25255 [Planctomycetota bacterium]|jgi:uncharacterized membrane protein
MEIVSDEKVLVRARSFARDGLLFFCIGQVALAIGLALMFLSHNQSQEILTGFIMSGSAWTVLSGAAFIKVMRARMLGLRNFVTLTAVLLGALFGLGVWLALSVAAVRSEWPSVAVWLIVVALAVLATAYFREKLSKEHAGLWLIVLGYMLLIFGVVKTLAAVSIFWGRRPVLHELPLIVAGLSEKTEGACLPFYSVPWLVLCTAGLWMLRSAAPANGWANEFHRFLKWAFLVILAEYLLLFYNYECSSGLAGALLVLPCAAAAIALGLWVARRQQHPSWLRLALCSLPFLLLGLGILVPFAGLAVTTWQGEAELYQRLETDKRSTRNVNWGYREQMAFWASIQDRDWTWHIPNLLRTPFGKIAAAISRDFARDACVRGTAGNADIHIRAVSPPASRGGQEWSVWMTWGARDPQDILAVSLAVRPTALGSTKAVTSYDRLAGACIGGLAPVEEIRKRLFGPYSGELRQGILYGIGAEAVTTGLFDDILKGYENGTLPAASWAALCRMNPARTADLIKDYIQAPNTTNVKRLKESERWWAFLPRAPELLDAGLASDNSDVRKSALNSAWSMTRSPESTFKVVPRLPRLLDIAEGKLPGSDADEQRSAAQVLNSGLKLRESYIHISRATPGTPLKADEIEQIKRICQKARERLR